jgi:hypothetical protein
VVYGTAVAVAFDLLRPASAKKLVALGAALGATRGLPALIRRPVRSALGVVRGAEIGDRLREVADASLGV